MPRGGSEDNRKGNVYIRGNKSEHIQREDGKDMHKEGYADT